MNEQLSQYSVLMLLFLYFADYVCICVFKLQKRQIKRENYCSGKKYFIFKRVGLKGVII